MAKSTNDTEKQANKDIADVINYFYSKYKGTKPDASHYKQNHSVLKLLMYPSEEYRTYSAREIKNVIDELSGHHIALLGLTILYWPDLIRSFVDGDVQTQKYILKAIKQNQAKEGIYSTDPQDLPKGW